MLESEIEGMKWELEILQQRFSHVEKERDELYTNFVDKVLQVQQKTGVKNSILEKKMEGMKETLEKKELHLNELLSSMNLDPNALGNLTKRLDGVVESKNAQIKQLQYELAKLTKTHNDVMNVYEAKLAEFSIPIDELGLKPLMVSKSKK